MSETWRVSSINDGYEVSSFGRIRSRERFVDYRSSHRACSYRKKLKPQMLRSFISKSTGYMQVRLGKSGRQSVHRLVALEFCQGFSDELIVNHKNGVRDDNRAENLEWVTPGENIAHAFRELGRKPTFLNQFGHSHSTSKPVISTCMTTGEDRYYECAHDARHEGFDSGSISRCCNGKIRHHKGRYWKFALPGDHRFYGRKAS